MNILASAADTILACEYGILDNPVGRAEIWMCARRLAQHAANYLDDEPVTPEWLQQFQGWESRFPPEMWEGQPYDDEAKALANKHWWYRTCAAHSDTEMFAHVRVSFADGPRLSVADSSVGVATRGRLRQVCDALGVPLVRKPLLA